MEYRKFGKTNEEVSIYGCGCMRFRVNDGKIDENEAVKMIRSSIEKGVNYMDTAYMYHGGQSEPVLGKALSDGYRSKVFVADKLPVWCMEKKEDFTKILDTQLKRLGTDYIDFYLVHSMTENYWNNQVVDFDVLHQMEEAKKAGKIRHIGFSFHDSFDVFKKVIDGYDKWEFCQIQFNYACTYYQAGLKGLKYAGEKGLGVTIMEPLYAGRLANPTENMKKSIPKGKTPVDWGLSYLWSFPEVSVVISGANDTEQSLENISYAENFKKISEDEMEMLENAGKILRESALVGCTKCAYCMPCPMGIDIVKLYEIYNKTTLATKEWAREEYQKLEKNADDCVFCKACKSRCPQAIDPEEFIPKIKEYFKE